MYINSSAEYWWLDFADKVYQMSRTRLIKRTGFSVHFDWLAVATAHASRNFCHTHNIPRSGVGSGDDNGSAVNGALQTSRKPIGGFSHWRNRRLGSDILYSQRVDQSMRCVPPSSERLSLGKICDRPKEGSAAQGQAMW